RQIGAIGGAALRARRARADSHRSNRAGSVDGKEVAASGFRRSHAERFRSHRQSLRSGVDPDVKFLAGVFVSRSEASLRYGFQKEALEVELVVVDQQIPSGAA